jgi:hypothetical protein
MKRWQFERHKKNAAQFMVRIYLFGFWYINKLRLFHTVHVAEHGAKHSKFLQKIIARRQIEKWSS